MIRNEVVRDERLSYRARGVLAYILSHVSDWETNASKLAEAAPNGEGREAVRAALRELEQTGYLRREKVQVPKTRQWTTRLHWHGVRQDESAAHADAREPVVGLPGVGSATAGFRASQEDHLEDHQEDATQWPSLASSFGAQREDPDVNRNWRAQDRQVWRDLLGGDLLLLEGNHWSRPETTGRVYAADLVYDAYWQDRKKRYPGRWLLSIVDRDGGVEEWIAQERWSLVAAERRGDGTLRCDGCGERIVLTESQRSRKCFRCRHAPQEDPWADPWAVKVGA